MTVLSEIVENVRSRVEREKKENPKEEVEHPGARSLKKSIESNSSGASVIAELKRASPSAGEIRSDFPVSELAESVARGGAVGISVLTEPEWFEGRKEFLTEVREEVDLPVLRKDFIVDEYQLYQSAEIGADAVLLIAEVLGSKLPKFVSEARDLGMESLVEVSNKDQANIACFAEPDLLGINNRDLKTMEIDISRTEEIQEYLPEEFVSISESGIESRQDVDRVLGTGVDAVLVGTAVMEAEDVESKVRELASGGS
ncbi:hypothetical protein AKJ41_04130 [candidate division MSBL1 archaeon SCGC-AAA259O05]|uniref:Indole-3-glycerol phosphate synthase n=1 Tax=candidate division MSBL1 archaeon SCGC-AAA259O05 TaxID=1698271 RepID=A0A133V1P2_9EURY|nr:hypothetical protein AKJ41_04130 [candidate division MSBL1 archaeon SCGC-AAA259O05]